MRAVILAGGRGTRLRPYTASIPKPLLPIGDLPILEVVLKQLARHGFDHVTLLLNHMSHLFIAILGDGERFGIKIDFVIEDAPLGTAGSIAMVEALPDNFLIMNGDLLTTLDYNFPLEVVGHAGSRSDHRRPARKGRGNSPRGSDKDPDHAA